MRNSHEFAPPVFSISRITRRNVELIQATLEAEGIARQVTRLDSEPDFSAALEHAPFDLILTD